MNSKPIILLVRRHAGEIDWILPLLYKLKNKDYRIITIFSEPKGYTSLRDNKEIYDLWKKVSSNYLILNKQNYILWKILHKIILSPLILQFDLFKKFDLYILKKIFVVNELETKLNFKIKNIKAIFTPSINFSRLPILFKNYNKKISIIRFPESSMITSTKIENPNLKYNNSFKNNEGDLFLFANKADKNFFLGEKTKKNVYICGSLRHGKWWIKKFLSKKSKLKYFKVLVPIRNPQKNYLSEKSFIETLDTILKVLNKIKNIKIIFKMHPQDKYLSVITKILSKYKKNWTFKRNHMYKLSSETDACVGMITSACMDSLAVGIPTIEYYDVDKELIRSPNVKGCVHMAFSKRTNKWKTIFNLKKIVKTVKNSSQLEKNINLIYHKKYENIHKLNRKYFRQLINTDENSLNKLIKYFEKNLIN